jgi:hypothetical protein
MTPDLDVVRAASLLIGRHGADAAIFAAQRANAMLDRGDRYGQSVWLRIKSAIVALQGGPDLSA